MLLWKVKLFVVYTIHKQSILSLSKWCESYTYTSIQSVISWYKVYFPILKKAESSQSGINHYVEIYKIAPLLFVQFIYFLVPIYFFWSS